MDEPDDVVDAVLAALDGVPRPTHVHEILAGLNRASERRVPWPDADGLAPGGTDDLPVEVVHLDALATAFMYHYRSPGSRPGDAFHGGGYLNRARKQWPPPLRQLPAAIMSIWERYAAVAETPLVRARLHDLLFEARHGEVRAHAPAAVEAYLDGAKQVEHAISAVCLLERALELSRAIRQDDQLERVTEQLLGHAEAALEGSSWEPGVTVDMLAPLVSRGLEPDKTSVLLGRALTAYRDDPHVTDKILTMIRSQASTDTERGAVDRRRVQSWLDAAGQTTGLVRHMHLTKAAELGRDLGVNDLARQAVVALQAIDRDDLGLQPIGVLVQVPAETFERFRDVAMNASTLAEALWALVDTGAPAGDIAHNRQEVADQGQTFRFASLVIPVHLNYGALPQYSPTTAESRDEYELTQFEVAALRISGGMLEVALDSVHGRIDRTETDLVAIFQQEPTVPEPVARSLARAFGHYWNNDPEAACTVALPRIETLARALLAQHGVAVFSLQQGPAAGHMSMLATLLQRLANHVADESWNRSLQALLVKPGVGLNLRNDILHGLLDRPPSRAEAALVLQAALFLLSLLHNRSPHRDDTASG